MVLTFQKKSFQVYIAIEDTDSREQRCCTASLMSDIKVIDLYKNEIIRINRVVTGSRCFNTIKISSPPGQMIASVHEQETWWYPTYTVKDQSGETVFLIDMCPSWSCNSDTVFKVNFLWKWNRSLTRIEDEHFFVWYFGQIADVNGKEIGNMTKKSYQTRKLSINGDALTLNFPIDLDVEMKAALISAGILIVSSSYSSFFQNVFNFSFICAVINHLHCIFAIVLFQDFLNFQF